jgi:hypothetical protein
VIVCPLERNHVISDHADDCWACTVIAFLERVVEGSQERYDMEADAKYMLTEFFTEEFE